MTIELLSTKEIAEEMGVSPHTVRGWIKRGVLVPDKKGHDNLVLRSTLEAFKLVYSPKRGPKKKRRRTIMITFNGDAGLKERSIAAFKKDMAMQRLYYGNYNPDGLTPDKFKRGCSVACTDRFLVVQERPDLLNLWESESWHKLMSEGLGVPLWYSYLIDRFFENCPRDSAAEISLRIREATPVGVDLDKTLVKEKLMLFVLVDPKAGVLQYAKKPKTIESINRVAGLYNRIISGNVVSIEEWRSANAAANAAAYAPTTAAAYAAANAAAYAAAAYAAANAAAYAAAAYAPTTAAAAKTSRMADYAREFIRLLAGVPSVVLAS